MKDTANIAILNILPKVQIKVLVMRGVGNDVCKLYYSLSIFFPIFVMSLQ